jgi:hypothetical protein
MKKIFLILLLTPIILCCNKPKITHVETVTKYYNAKDNQNYEGIKRLINDSITIIEGDYVMPYNPKTFYEVFKWDSIFKTSSKIVDLKVENNEIIATVSSYSARFEFLNNNPLTCQQKIYFNSDKISKIELLKCIDTDWNIWQKERDSLVNWINNHHSNLNGFINDMSMNGALNYLKAIELYRADKIDFNH